MVKIAIITYSTYGHINTLSKAIKGGIEAAGGAAVIYRVEETLPEDVLQKMNAPAKPSNIPVANKETLESYDAFLFGIPTRYGNIPAQWSAFWDRTGGLWVNGTLNGKAVGFFVSTASYGGGQESTIQECLSYVVHHGMIYIPLGYKNVFAELANIEEIHGGSAWGSGTLAASDGSRTASNLELRIAKIQGKTFYQTVQKLYGGTSTVPSGEAAATTTSSAPAEGGTAVSTVNEPKNRTQAAQRQTRPGETTKENKKASDCCIIT
ncbi:hypothetical protein KAFR_0H03060 [Kazachstania africana CBS 2517]|uniref:Flavodoxin-like domain-containing protein n=1 Tax=Kazachstania africana (strain ATCC 22294 / BCRC 22015 / CBS 2517 / CECT 1963 / NBRC 1671 / NRRL Y-8276) TaxID=1071382 RepID=H2AZG0_KAZAF|nr:hypothetical protein KAFR_0H03060 [Kazachstania africana CBS 2517]CCF59716.1 hypothetical protein KAFR_0H03060 [Kazachstania africana CBS 2517]